MFYFARKMIFLIYIKIIGYNQSMIKDKLRNIEMFNPLSNDELEKIVNISSVKKLSRDNILFYEGEKPQYFYLLLEGFVKFYKTDLKGNEVIMHFFSTPTFIAEMPSFENIPFPATAVVMREESEFLLIEREKFLELLANDTRFTFYIVKSLTHKVRTLEQVINRNLIYDAMTKVCAFIKENPSEVVNSKHKEIATILNMAPETLSRILKRLKTLNIIDKEYRLLDSDKLDMFLEF